MEETDAVVIGAGPVGLFQVFQLGLQGLKAHVVDTLPHAGGQCVQLYGDKLIYDIPGVLACTGLELTARLQQQITPFTPDWHFNCLVVSVESQHDGRVLVETSAGAKLLARAVFLAAGVGAFLPRVLKTEGIDTFVGTQVFYQALPPQADATGRRVVVHGGDEGAVACALELAEQNHAASITLLHRRDVFQAPPALLQRLQQQRDAGRIAVAAAQIVGIDADNAPDTAPHTRLKALRTVDTEGNQRALPVDLLLAVLGISPRLGPIADWGLAMERKQLVVNPATFATNVPGIYAVGDVITYPGKRKLRQSQTSLLCQRFQFLHGLEHGTR
ncbi:MAG: NAD(P)/FAD-dependent oxidoreductase [Burkholderiaceae bacterium]|nr:NAD(P)/FAD-dependent oxidoreductase [Burkholderiaceae bacterium]